MSERNRSFRTLGIRDGASRGVLETRSYWPGKCSHVCWFFWNNQIWFLVYFTIGYTTGWIPSLHANGMHLRPWMDRIYTQIVLDCPKFSSTLEFNVKYKGSNFLAGVSCTFFMTVDWQDNADEKQPVGYPFFMALSSSDGLLWGSGLMQVGGLGPTGCLVPGTMFVSLSSLYLMCKRYSK